MTKLYTFKVKSATPSEAERAMRESWTVDDFIFSHKSTMLIMGDLMRQIAVLAAENKKLKAKIKKRKRT